jgi:hypothetical protein
MFRDNTESTLTPQDGNSLAVLFNATISDAQKQSISTGLLNNWQVSGAVTPEVRDTSRLTASRGASYRVLALGHHRAFRRRFRGLHAFY